MALSDILSMRSKADQHYQTKKYEDAMALYSQLVENNPYDSGLKIKLGHCLAEVGRGEQAIKLALEALALGCTFPWVVQYEIAKLHAKLGNKQASLDWLERALANRWEDRPGITEDDAFTAFRTDPQFLRLVGAPNEAEIDRESGWSLDLDHLVAEAQRLHIGPERHAFSDQFLTMVNALRERISLLSDEALIVEMQRLVAQLGDGHSRIYPLRSMGNMQFAKLPVDFYYFHDGLFIIDGLDDMKQHIGSQVLKFGSRKTEDIVTEIKDFISADNAMTVKWMMPIYLKQPAYLQALGATDNTTSVTLTIRDQQNNIRDIVLNSNYEPIEMSDVFRKLRPSQLHEEPPLYLQNVGTHYWMQSFANSNAIYVQYNQVRNIEGQPISEFADQLLEVTHEMNPSALIVDIRNNDGGNSFFNRPLLRTLVHFDTAHSDNRIFVLIGRNTFSAAQNFVNVLESMVDAIFIGEPTGSSLNFIGESTNVRLPYSGVNLSISSRLHYTSFWGDNRPWIAPHVLIELSSDDYFANRDPVLEAVLDLIGIEDADG